MDEADTLDLVPYDRLDEMLVGMMLKLASRRAMDDFWCFRVDPVPYVFLVAQLSVGDSSLLEKVMRFLLFRLLL